MCEQGFAELFHDSDGTPYNLKPCAYCGRSKALFYIEDERQHSAFKFATSKICWQCSCKFDTWYSRTSCRRPADVPQESLELSFNRFLKDRLQNLSLRAHKGTPEQRCEMRCSSLGDQCYSAATRTFKDRPVCQNCFENVWLNKEGDVIDRFIDQPRGYSIQIVDLIFSLAQYDAELKTYLLQQQEILK